MYSSANLNVRRFLELRLPHSKLSYRTIYQRQGHLHENAKWHRYRYFGAIRWIHLPTWASSLGPDCRRLSGHYRIYVGIDVSFRAYVNHRREIREENKPTRLNLQKFHRTTRAVTHRYVCIVHTQVYTDSSVLEQSLTSRTNAAFHPWITMCSQRRSHNQRKQKRGKKKKWRKGMCCVHVYSLNEQKTNLRVYVLR